MLDLFMSTVQAQKGKPYVWGSDGPGSFDCSGLIVYGLQATGVLRPGEDRHSSALIDMCTPITVKQGLSTRGAFLYMPGHIAVSVGDGRTTIEARNPDMGVGNFESTGRGWTRAGLLPQFKETTVAKYDGLMASPVKASRVSCEWRGYKNHSGMDLVCPVGTPVYAAYGGKVEKQGTNCVAGRTGKGKVIRNPDREAQYYGHLSGFVGKVGDTVKQGQLIGYSGATGHVTGPHLHFETWKKGARGQYGGDTNPRVHFNSHHLKVGSTTGQKKTALTRSIAAGLNVRTVQKQLKAAGYYSGRIDGKDKEMTADAVLAYQKAQIYFPGMKRDGFWGAMTQAHYLWVKKLQKALNKIKVVKAKGKVKIDGDYASYTGFLVKIVQKVTPAYSRRYKLDRIAGSAFCKAIGLVEHPSA